MQNLWSKTGRGFALSALALALTACQSMRGPEPVVNPQVENQFNLLPQAANQPSIAELGYKDFFSDERLIKIIDLALQNNRDLRVAALNVDKIQQQYRITQNNQLPTIGSSGSVIRQETASSNSATTIYSISAGITSYELDFWGRVRSLKDAALDNYLATQSSKDAVKISLISQVAQAWLNYAYANAHLNLAKQTLNAQQESYQLNQKRFNAGIDSEIPLRQSQISVETARNDVANYQTQVAQAKNALQLLVGQQLDEQLLETKAIPIISQAKFGTGLSSELLNNRPDLRAAQYQLSAAGANIAVAKASLYPTISLTGTAGLATTDLSDLFKSGAFIWSFGPSLNLPIFDWGTRKANIKISEADQKIALANYEKAIQTAFTEVNNALATRAFIIDRITAQQRLVEATKVNYKLATARFRAGIDSYLNVLDAQRTAYTAEQSLLTLYLANLNNQIELYKVLGGGIKTYQTDTIYHQPSSTEKLMQHQNHQKK